MTMNDANLKAETNATALNGAATSPSKAPRGPRQI